MIKELIKSHKFFFKESGRYLGGWTIKNIIRLPMAYIKFMYMCFEDIRTNKKQNDTTN